MPDNSSLELSKSKMETTPFFVADLTEKRLCPMPGTMMIAIRARCCSPAIVGDEALKYPFGRAVQQGSSGSDNLTWHSEKNVVLRKASAARINKRLLRYYLIVRLLPNVFALACRS